MYREVITACSDLSHNFCYGSPAQKSCELGTPVSPYISENVCVEFHPACKITLRVEKLHLCVKLHFCVKLCIVLKLHTV